jgi:hypothetical protein
LCASFVNQQGLDQPTTHGGGDCGSTGAANGDTNDLRDLPQPLEFYADRAVTPRGLAFLAVAIEETPANFTDGTAAS